MMRVDYRWLRLASVPLYLVAIVLLILVFVPSLNIVVGGSARWLQIGPLPAVHPAEFAKLALIIYLAHWFAKRGSRVRGFWGGTVPFLVIVAPVIALVLKEPDLGTTAVIALTAFTMFFVAGANLVHLGAMAAGGAMACSWSACTPTSSTGSRPGSNPWPDPLGHRLPHDPGPAGAGPRRPPGGRARREPARRCPCPTPATTSSSRSSARSSGCSARTS